MFSQHWFALLADETRDISNRKQLVLCIELILLVAHNYNFVGCWLLTSSQLAHIRWVSDSYEINEDVVGLIQLSDTTAETIYKSLKFSLISLGFQFEYCRGQAYGGASNFQGHISGVGKRFQSAAVPIHCLA